MILPSKGTSARTGESTRGRRITRRGEPRAREGPRADHLLRSLRYHGHVGGEYMDGLRGSLIIHDPSDPYRHDYDEEYTLTMSDWYHEQAPALLGTYINSKNPQGNEPVPDGVLFNDGQDVKFRMQPGKTYRFRFICMSAFGAILVKFDQHDMTVVEMDGVYTEKKTVKELYVAAAQRYSVLVTAKATAGENYAIVGSKSDGYTSHPPILHHLTPARLEPHALTSTPLPRARPVYVLPAIQLPLRPRSARLRPAEAQP